MKSTMTTAFAALAMMVAAASAEEAQSKLPEATFGVVRLGMQVSAVGSATFPTNSAIGRTILSACKEGTFCKLRALSAYDTHTVEKVVSVAPAPRFTDPTEMLEWIYDQYDDNGFGGSIWLEEYRDLVSIYTPSMAKLIVAEVARGKKDQDEAFATVWFQSQEGKPVKRRVRTVMTRPDRAKTTVSYFISDYDEGKKQSVIFYLVATPAGWRIDDAKYQVAKDVPDYFWRKQLINISKGKYNAQ